MAQEPMTEQIVITENPDEEEHENNEILIDETFPCDHGLSRYRNTHVYMKSARQPKDGFIVYPALCGARHKYRFEDAELKSMKVFKDMNESFEFSEEAVMYPLFGREYPFSDGKREWLTGPYKALFDTIEKMFAKNAEKARMDMRYHEYLSSVLPVKIFLDIEAHKNEDMDRMDFVSSCVYIVISLCDFIKARYEIELDPRHDFLYDMCTYPDKFSMHVTMWRFDKALMRSLEHLERMIVVFIMWLANREVASSKKKASLPHTSKGRVSIFKMETAAVRMVTKRKRPKKSKEPEKKRTKRANGDKCPSFSVEEHIEEDVDDSDEIVTENIVGLYKPMIDTQPFGKKRGSMRAHFCIKSENMKKHPDSSLYEIVWEDFPSSSEIEKTPKYTIDKTFKLETFKKSLIQYFGDVNGTQVDTTTLLGSGLLPERMQPICEEVTLACIEYTAQRHLLAHSMKNVLPDLPQISKKKSAKDAFLAVCDLYNCDPEYMQKMQSRIPQLPRGSSRYVTSDIASASGLAGACGRGGKSAMFTIKNKLIIKACNDLVLKHYAHEQVSKFKEVDRSRIQLGGTVKSNEDRSIIVFGLQGVICEIKEDYSPGVRHSKIIKKTGGDRGMHLVIDTTRCIYYQMCHKPNCVKHVVRENRSEPVFIPKPGCDEVDEIPSRDKRGCGPIRDVPDRILQEISYGKYQIDHTADSPNESCEV